MQQSYTMRIWYTKAFAMRDNCYLETMKNSIGIVVTVMEDLYAAFTVQVWQPRTSRKPCIKVFLRSQDYAIYSFFGVDRQPA